MNQSPSTFSEWIDALDSGQRTGMIALSIVAIVLVLAIFMITLYKVHKNRLEDALKRELLDRGMSAAEIAMVVRARPGTDRAADAIMN
jgi:sensor histidine kinase regulating citrate/malate metabolism